VDSKKTKGTVKVFCTNEHDECKGMIQMLFFIRQFSGKDFAFIAFPACSYA